MARSLAMGERVAGATSAATARSPRIALTDPGLARLGRACGNG